MFSVKAQAVGANRFRRMVNPAGTITKASWALMRRQGAVYLAAAIRHAPVDTGQLQSSHILRVNNPFNAEVVNTALTESGDPYPKFVHGGTRPHMPPASSGLPWPVRRHIAEHGTRANPWMDRAFEEAGVELAANLDKMGQEIMEEFSSE